MHTIVGKAICNGSIHHHFHSHSHHVHNMHRYMSIRDHAVQDEVGCACKTGHESLDDDASNPFRNDIQ